VSLIVGIDSDGTDFTAWISVDGAQTVLGSVPAWTDTATG
jgi:hypothetical protein